MNTSRLRWVDESGNSLDFGKVFSTSQDDVRRLKHDVTLICKQQNQDEFLQISLIRMQNNRIDILEDEIQTLKILLEEEIYFRHEREKPKPTIVERVKELFVDFKKTFSEVDVDVDEENKP